MPDNQIAPINSVSFLTTAKEFKDLDPAAFKEFLTMYREEQDRNALAAFNEAYAATCAEILKVKKDKTNPLFRARYSSYEALWDAVEPVANRYGLRVSFGTEPTGNPDMLRLFIIIAKGTHTQREGIDFSVPNEGPKGGRPAMTPAQAMGSAITYARKYLLQLALNLVPSEKTDDDGNSAAAHAEQPRPRQNGGGTAAEVDTRSKQAAQESRERSANGGLTKEQAARKAANADRERVFLDEFKARCAAAMSQEDAVKIIMDEGITPITDWLYKNSKDGWREYCEIRDAMTERLSPTPGDATLPTDPPL